MALSHTQIIEKTVDRVREFIADGMNSSTYIDQPVPISYRSSDGITKETVAGLAGRLVEVTDKYRLRISRVTLADELSRSQILVHLTNP